MISRKDWIAESNSDDSGSAENLKPARGLTYLLELRPMEGLRHSAERCDSGGILP